jgi:hypothetical protein
MIQMEEDKKQIKTLLKNIQEGLSKYSISELNRALLVALNKKHDKSDDIDYPDIEIKKSQRSGQRCKTNNILSSPFDSGSFNTIHSTTDIL